MLFEKLSMQINCQALHASNHDPIGNLAITSHGAEHISHHYYDTEVSDRALLAQGNIRYKVTRLIDQEERARYRSRCRQVRRDHKRKTPRPLRYGTHNAISVEIERLVTLSKEAQGTIPEKDSWSLIVHRFLSVPRAGNIPLGDLILTPNTPACASTAKHCRMSKCIGSCDARNAW